MRLVAKSNEGLGATLGKVMGAKIIEVIRSELDNWIGVKLGVGKGDKLGDWSGAKLVER